MKQNSWDGILDDGERLLWQGQPGKRLSAKPGQIVESVIGLFFIVFSVFWMKLAMSMRVGPHWAFGLIFLGLGLYNFVGKYLWQAYARGHTWYSISDRRAFIASDTPIGGRRLKSYPITGDTVLDFQPGAPAAVYFDEETYRANGRTRVARVGFEHLNDGQSVYRILRQVQKGKA